MELYGRQGGVEGSRMESGLGAKTDFHRPSPTSGGARRSFAGLEMKEQSDLHPQTPSNNTHPLLPLLLS